MGFQRFGIIMTGLLALAAAGRATTTYSSAAAFNAGILGAGLSVAPTITFTSDVCALCASVTDSNITFSSNEMIMGTPGAWPDGNVLERSTGGGTISITPSGTYFAFALNIVTVSGAAFPIDVLFNDGSAQDFSPTTTGVTGGGIFFGAISATPITGLQVTTSFNSLTFGIDDVQIGSQSATPEGSTMLLIGLGLIVLHLFHRRRRANVVG